MSPQLSGRHSTYAECLFFNANTSKVDSSKIIEMYLRTFKIKVLVFIILPPFN